MPHPIRGFPTRSTYEGAWNEPLKIMDGFGTYTYPDGSEYRGYFVNGLFEGYGSLKIIYPHKFIIKGNFERGCCKCIQDLRFGDGLRFHGSINDDGTLNSKDWKYCTEQDRRYYNEVRYNIEPYGSHSNTTSKTASRIPRGTYDTSEGFYQPRTGFLSITQNTLDERKMRFIACPKDREWIVKNCRLAKKTGVGFKRSMKANPEDAHKIVYTNLTSTPERSEDLYCICKAEADCERHFGNLCLESSCCESDDLKCDQNEMLLTPSSSSIQSFDDNALDPRSWAAEDELKSAGENMLLSEEDLAHAKKVKIMKVVM